MHRVNNPSLDEWPSKQLHNPLLHKGPWCARKPGRQCILVFPALGNLKTSADYRARPCSSIQNKAKLKYRKAKVCRIRYQLYTVNTSAVAHTVLMMAVVHSCGRATAAAHGCSQESGTPVWFCFFYEIGSHVASSWLSSRDDTASSSWVRISSYRWKPPCPGLQNGSHLSHVSTT